MKSIIKRLRAYLRGHHFSSYRRGVARERLRGEVYEALADLAARPVSVQQGAVQSVSVAFREPIRLEDLDGIALGAITRRQTREYEVRSRRGVWMD